MSESWMDGFVASIFIRELVVHIIFANLFFFSRSLASAIFPFKNA